MLNVVQLKATFSNWWIGWSFFVLFFKKCLTFISSSSFRSNLSSHKNKKLEIKKISISDDKGIYLVIGNKISNNWLVLSIIDISSLLYIHVNLYSGITFRITFRITSVHFFLKTLFLDSPKSFTNIDIDNRKQWFFVNNVSYLWFNKVYILDLNFFTFLTLTFYLLDNNRY